MQFLDGDFIETFLEMADHAQNELVTKALNDLQSEDLYKEEERSMEKVFSSLKEVRMLIEHLRQMHN
jgi:hypothetical protein